MRPVAILATNINPDYLSCLPMVCKSWQLQGFDVLASIVVDQKETEHLNICLSYCPENTSFYMDYTKPLPSVNNALYVQCVRLYMPLPLHPERVFVISDVDMFIASSFLYRDFDKVNSFGWDLTGFGENPMCYISSNVAKWREIMRATTMQEDIDKYGQQHSEDWYKAWACDQMILTAKLKEYGHDKINFINRGHDNRNSGLPLGRLDRYNWVYPTSEIHDVHMMRNPLSDENFPKITEMCQRIYPTEDWSWLHDYRKEFNEAL